MIRRPAPLPATGLPPNPAPGAAHPPATRASAAWGHGPAGALLLGALCFAAALLSLVVSRQPGSIATIWFANAVAIAALSMAPPVRWGLPVIAVSLAIVLANLAWGDDLLAALGFVPTNLVEILLGATLLRRARLHERGLESPSALALLLVAGGIVPQLVGATAGAALLAAQGAVPFAEVWPLWFVGSAIGAVSALPLAFVACQRGAHALRTALLDRRLVPLGALALGITLLCLHALPHPFVVVLLPLLVAAMVLELAAVALLSFAVSVTIALSMALGVFVPPPTRAGWEEAALYLAYACALVPAQLLAATMAALRDSRVRLEQAHAELQRTHDSLEQFVRIASHDLREPLNTVVQFGRLVDEDEGARLTPQGRQFMGLVLAAAARMRQLLDDCLSHERARSAELSLQPVELARLFDELQAVLAGRLRESGAQLAVGPMPALQGDPVLLSLLFQNLLSNALKFVPPGRQPRVVVTAEADGRWVRVAVADNGIGIEPADLQRLFKPFQRLHARRHFDGTGLGLALAREIAERHGGRIEVESVPGEGTRFTVVLPLVRS